MPLHKRTEEHDTLARLDELRTAWDVEIRTRPEHGHVVLTLTRGGFPHGEHFAYVDVKGRLDVAVARAYAGEPDDKY